MKNPLFVPSLRLMALSGLLFSSVSVVQPAKAAQPLYAPGITGSTDPSAILPVSLGKPSGCLFASTYALNNGAYPADLTVVGGVSCEEEVFLPYTWRNGSWSPVELPEGDYWQGYAASVSDDIGSEPAITFHLFDETEPDWTSWVLSPGQPPVQLSLLSDATFLNSAIISAKGNRIVGGNSNSELETERAVLWRRVGSRWRSPEDLAQGEAVATSDDGSVVIGNSQGGSWGWHDGLPWVWTANSSGGGQVTPMDPEASVYDITHDGSMIVGSRPKTCDPSWNCDLYPVPVYWVLEAGRWTMHDLEALDGVDSIAMDVEEVNGQPVIVGYGWTSQDGWNLRGVAWIPLADGSYGPPVRLEALAGNFNSWVWVTDINRNGLVLGWSEIEPWGATAEVIWNLSNPFHINAGLNGAWYNPDTNAQGFFISVLPDSGQIFLAWFTFDTERPPESVSANLGDPGHRWLTAAGAYEGNQALLDIELTQGGTFDSATPPTAQEPDGTVTLHFTSCNEGTITFHIPSINQHGVIPIRRLAPDNIPTCEDLDGSLAIGQETGSERGPKIPQAAASVTAAANDFVVNAGLNDAWYNSDTGGQGFFLDVSPDSHQAFLAWFTYDTERPDDSVEANLGEPGHRWLTAFGNYSGNQVELDIEVTKGGVFNSADPAPTQSPDGTITLEFSDCNTGTVNYDIPSIGKQGEIPIERIALDNVPSCEAIQAQ